MKKILLDKDELYQKYILECMPQKDVAKYYGVSVDTIVSNLKYYGIQSHKLADFCVKPQVFLNKIQKDYLTGALLGDGCLYKHKSGINAQFTYTTKSFQHISFIANQFLDILYKEGIKYYSYTDQRNNKQYSRYSIRTVADRTFMDEYEKWYINGVKHLPNGLELNPVVCLIWYLGDGCICHSNRSEYIKLATQCFNVEEQEKILIPQLSNFSARLMKGDLGNNGEQQYFIYIPRTSIVDFLNYIGECPFSDYKYKWETRPYKNFVACKSQPIIDRMIELFKSGMSSGSIAKELNVDRSTVVKYLSINGFNYRDNLFKRGD